MFCPAGECPFRDECADRTARAAVVYAALGYAVYPAGPTSQAHRSHIGTFPRGEGGFRQATTDLAVVSRGRDGVEWAEAWRMPGTSIGIATGLPSRLIVIDIDPDIAKVAKSGSVSFTDTVTPDETPARLVREWAAQKNVLLPGNVIATTPSGAGRQHVWIRLPETWTVEIPRQLGWFEHVDLCADRHSIKAPPSVRPATADKPGGEYRFARGCPCQVPDATPELLAAILATPASATPVSRAEHNGAESAEGEDGPMDVTGMKENGVTHNQNFVFKQMACSLLSRGWNARREDSDTPAAEIIDLLMEAAENSPQINPDWPWRRTDMVRIESAAREYIKATRQAEARHNREYVKNMHVRRHR